MEVKRKDAKKEERIELEDRPAERREEEKRRILVCPHGQAIYTAYEIYHKAL